MKKKINNETLKSVPDAITEKAIKFTVTDDQGVEHPFEIKPPTLGKLEIIAKHACSLEIDDKALESNPMRECMRLSKEQTENVVWIMALATLDGKEKLLDDDIVKARADFFKWSCYPKDFVVVLMTIFSLVGYRNFTNSIRWIRTLLLNDPTFPDETDLIETSADGRHGAGI